MAQHRHTCYLDLLRSLVSWSPEDFSQLSLSFVTMTFWKRSVDRVLRMSLVLGFSWLCPPDEIQTTRLWQEFCGSCAGSLWTIGISFPQCVWLPYVLFSGLWEDFRLLPFSKLGSSQSWCCVCEGWVSAEAQAAVFFWRWRRPEGRPLWKVTLRERRKDLKAGATMDSWPGL